MSPTLVLVAVDEVVQLYITRRQERLASSTRAEEFDRVTLKVEKKRVTFNRGPDELRYWTTSRKGWVQDAEAFDLWVGNDSTAELSAGFTVVR